MNRLTRKYLLPLFGVVGIVLLIIGVWITADKLDLVSNGMRADGTVVDLKREYSSSNGSSSYVYYPIVKFRTEGGGTIEFRSSVGSSHSSYSRGEGVTVVYDPNDPERAEIDSIFALWGGSLIIFAVGAVFTAVGAGFWIVRARRRKLEGWMQVNGRRIEADVASVFRDTSFKVNGRSPWRIKAQWQDSTRQKLHIFESKRLWFDPEPFIGTETLTVLIDPGNPRRYVFDLSFLPEVVE
jgi:hypothetical protein